MTALRELQSHRRMGQTGQERTLDIGRNMQAYVGFDGPISNFATLSRNSET